MNSRSHHHVLQHALSTPGDLEWERVVQVRAGDERAFEAIFEEYYATLCDFAQSYVRSNEAAEELVQTVFLKIWEQRATWDPAGGVRPYLFAACRNRALGYLNHERVVASFAEAATRDDLAMSRGEQPRDPGAAIESLETVQALRCAIAGLPERRRLVVVLRWQHQMSYAEIARIMNISIRTAEVQMGRALTALRRHLAHLR